MVFYCTIAQFLILIFVIDFKKVCCLSNDRSIPISGNLHPESPAGSNANYILRDVAAPAPGSPPAKPRRTRPKTAQNRTKSISDIETGITSNKTWVVRENPAFKNETIMGLYGAKVVSPPAPPGASSVQDGWKGRWSLYPPGYQFPQTDGHRLKKRRLPPLRIANSKLEFDREDKETRYEYLPKAYDVRWDYPECKSISSIRYPFGCNGCWAFGATSVMTDRHCIYNFEKTGQLYLSTYEVLACVPEANGCVGGMEWDAFRYWVMSGIVTGGTAYGPANQPMGCLPLPIDIAKRKLVCPTNCTSLFQKPFQQDKTYGGDYYHWWFPSIETIQREIYVYGPVSAFFRVYEDFFDYGGGVYQHVYGQFKGTHVIKLIGWGRENGVDYWLAVNSWGTEFGENGLFKIRRGVNMCDVESRIGGVLPKEGVAN